MQYLPHQTARRGVDQRDEARLLLLVNGHKMRANEFADQAAELARQLPLWSRRTAFGLCKNGVKQIVRFRLHFGDSRRGLDIFALKTEKLSRLVGARVK